MGRDEWLRKVPSPGPRVLPLTDPGFAISLVGGASVILGSLVAATYALMKRSFFFGLSGNLDKYYSFLLRGYYSVDLMIALATVGAVSGVLVLALAILTRLHPDRSGSYGRLIVVLSIIGILGLALIASIIGVLGSPGSQVACENLNERDLMRRRHALVEETGTRPRV
jgi:hypothetical protein